MYSSRGSTPDAGGGASDGAEERECCDDWLHGISQEKVIADESTDVVPSGCRYEPGAAMIASHDRTRQPQCRARSAAQCLLRGRHRSLHSLRAGAASPRSGPGAGVSRATGQWLRSPRGAPAAPPARGLALRARASGGVLRLLRAPSGAVVLRPPGDPGLGARAAREAPAAAAARRPPRSVPVRGGHARRSRRAWRVGSFPRLPAGQCCSSPPPAPSASSASSRSPTRRWSPPGRGPCASSQTRCWTIGGRRGSRPASAPAWRSTPSTARSSSCWVRAAAAPAASAGSPRARLALAVARPRASPG